MAILKLYLTSLEPDIEQSICSQSLGGYCSNSMLYPETTVSGVVGLYDTSFSINVPADGWADWLDKEYIGINNEIIKVSPISGGSISVEERGFNNIFNMHKGGDIVTSISSNELFNDVFSDTRKQYRCLALKNLSSFLEPSVDPIPVAFAISVYFKQNSRNANSSVKMALEKPNSQYMESTSTSWNEMQIIDTTLIGAYSDNYFKECYLKIKSGPAEGQGKIISSFDSDTGTFTLYSSFSSAYDYSGNVKYEVEPAPAQRIKTGTVSPVTTGVNFLPFSSANENNPLYFAPVEDGSNLIRINLNPNDIMYIWFEREIQKGSEEFDNNDFVLNVKYDGSS
jgi:hypothetical protein